MPDFNTYFRCYDSYGRLLGQAMMTSNNSEQRITMDKAGTITEIRLENKMLGINRSLPNVRSLSNGKAIVVRADESVWIHPSDGVFIKID